MPLEDFRRNFGLDAEAVGLQVEAVEDLAAQHLVAGFHVRQHRVVEDVRNQRQQLIPEIVREQENAVLSKEPRPVHDVRSPFDDELGEAG
jgi:hypothetical protein